MAPAKDKGAAGMVAASPPDNPRRRADAQRSIAAILDAGLAYLVGHSDVNMGEIARRAGVGRVTLYSHFPSKEALVDAVVAHAMNRAAQVLAAVDLEEARPSDALASLARSSWQVLNEHRRLMVAGQRHLGPHRMRVQHNPAAARLRQLIERGQAAGEVRTDLPITWLLTTFYALLHAAAEEVNAGNLDAAKAGDMVAAIVTAALAAPR